MEHWEVIGVDMKAQVSFNDPGGKRTVNGVRWHLISDDPLDPQKYLGRMVKDQFISNERLATLNITPKPGDHIVMYFNRFGDIAKVDPAD